MGRIKLSKQVKTSDDQIEDLNYETLKFMAVVVGIIGGIVAVINFILTRNLDSPLKYSLCLLFLFFIIFLVQQKQNRDLNIKVQQLKSNYEYILESMEKEG
jgi:hypothetical protein